MRTVLDRLVMLTGVLVVALALIHGEPLLVATVAVVALAAASFVLAVPAREVTVGARARAHRESMVGMPAPAHPSTAGRPMARAPGETAAAYSY